MTPKAHTITFTAEELSEIYERVKRSVQEEDEEVSNHDHARIALLKMAKAQGIKL